MSENLSFESGSKAIKSEVCEEATAELGRRVDLWLQLRHRPEEEFVALSKEFLESASLCERIVAKKIVSFIEMFSGDAVFEHYLATLVRANRFDKLAESYSALNSTKNPRRRRAAFDALLRSATTASVDLTSTIGTLAVDELNPFASCWKYYHKFPMKAPVKSPERPEKFDDSSYKYEQNYTVEYYLYDLFFYELSQGCTNATVPKALYPKSSEFIDLAINVIVDCARNIASGISQLSFSTLYYAARVIAPIEERNFNDPSRRQYFGFRNAMRRIAVDMHIIKQPTGRFSHLSDAELTTARVSKHWSEELWLEEQLARNLPILTTAQASASLAIEIAYLDKHVTPFNERADKWALLSRFAILYQLPELATTVRRAADCALGHGWRKDLWMIDILDAVAEIHTQGAAQGLPMLRELVPIVDQITRFTDGDETDHVRSELIEVVGRVTPARLPNFYEHHLENDEFRYAEQVLEQHLRIANFESAVTRALAHTLAEDRDIAVLTDLASGSPKVAKPLADQLAFLGGRPPKKVEHSNTAPDYARSGTPPKVEKFGATEFRRLLERVADFRLGYEHQREALRDWLSYWEKQGSATAALESIKEYFEGEDQTHNADTILDDAFDVSRRAEGKRAAYYWLVKAHVHRNGWQSYWTSESESMMRLRRAAELYKIDWQKFVFDTSIPARYWSKRNYSFSIGSKYLVRFLLMVDQKQAAVDFARALVKTAREELSDQPLRECPWFN